MEETSHYPMSMLAEFARRREAEGESSSSSSSSSPEQDSTRIAWFDGSNAPSPTILPATGSDLPPIDYSSASSPNAEPFRTVASIAASDLIRSPTPLGADPLVIRRVGTDAQNTKRIITPKELDEVVDALGAELNLTSGFRRRTPLSERDAPGGLDFSMDLW